MVTRNTAVASPAGLYLYILQLPRLSSVVTPPVSRLNRFMRFTFSSVASLTPSFPSILSSTVDSLCLKCSGTV